MRRLRQLACPGRLPAAVDLVAPAEQVSDCGDLWLLEDLGGSREISFQLRHACCPHLGQAAAHATAARKNLFDLRRVAVVHNLHVIARQPTADGYRLAA